MSAVCGQNVALIQAMFTKYCLATLKLSDAERLEMLEQLAGLPFADITTEAIAAVEPCSHDVAQMVMDALDLPPEHPWHKHSHGYSILSTNPVWQKLKELNPSLDKAMKLCRYCTAAA